MPVVAEMHAFSLPDGRSLEAEIVDYNAKLNQVELKRTDGKRVKVKASIFVDEDQAYIKEWDAAKAFTSDRLLKISCTDETIEEWKKEEYKDLRDTEGNVENYLMKETMFERVVYTVVFQNTNPSVLDNIRMDYRIYYEQSKESRDKPVAEQKVLAGKATIPPLPGKSQKVAVSSDPVVIYKDNINSIDWSDGSARVGGEGKVHGMRARLYLKTPSGQEIMREFCSPSSLSAAKYLWKDGTPAAAKSKGGKKKGKRNKKG
jgi:hypothetical protein